MAVSEILDDGTWVCDECESGNDEAYDECQYCFEYWE